MFLRKQYFLNFSVEPKTLKQIASESEIKEEDPKNNAVDIEKKFIPPTPFILSGRRRKEATKLESNPLDGLEGAPSQGPITSDPRLAYTPSWECRRGLPFFCAKNGRKIKPNLFHFRVGK